MSLVVPAILPMSREDLEEKLKLFKTIPSVSRIQIDVVDGRFATPASWPYNAPEELQQWVDRRQMLPRLERCAYEIDLMCLDAEKAASAWLTLGATRLTFHAESTLHLSRMLTAARKRHGHFISFGLALNIESDIALIEMNLGEIEYVQFMGIAKIGQQGQPFDSRVTDKIRTFRARHPNIPIQVDGGVSLQNAKELLSLGVSSLIVGSAIIHANDPYAAVEAFENTESPFGI